MGVPKFYRWISERYPCLSEVVKEYQIPEFDNLYLDMNGVVHVCSHPEDDNPHFRITEEKIFEDIFHYIEVLFRMIKPRKVFFMAIDGVAPRAKMNQQRGRRFRSAREAEELVRKAVEKGEILPKEQRFDSNCITPGTPFMVNLQEQLKYFITKKISEDRMWQGVKVYLSGHETPGEGEHKVMDFIRYEKSQPGYDSNTRHCLYGLDADLIMLGLVSHEPHFSLLREEVRFGGKNSQKRSTAPEDTTFHLLHLCLMREYLDFEFSPVKGKLPFEYDLERIIDDWVLMGFLVGNDFIPHLPHMHIHQDALPMLWKTYMEVLPTLDGYMNENGYLMLPRFEKFLKSLSKIDLEQFSEQYADLKWFEGKTGRSTEDIRNKWAHKKRKTKKQKVLDDGVPLDNEFAILGDIDRYEGDFGLEDQEAAVDLELDNGCLDEVEESRSEEDLMFVEFEHQKASYYRNKLGYEQVTLEVLQEQACGYVKAIQWILHYYFNGVPSWGWFYDHHYAPYLSDIKDFSDMEMEFELGKPFLPFEQLMAVLPAASKDLLPKSCQILMTDTNSPIIEFYPVEFETDLNGKRQDWEAVVLIPFIEEERLLNAMKSALELFSPDEKLRNRHSAHLLFDYVPEATGDYSSPHDIFPKILFNHAKCTKLHQDLFRIEHSKLKCGLCEDVKLDVYFPGFPTMKHLPHRNYLKKEGVKVFQMNSRGDNMILHILDGHDPDEDLEKIADDYLGQSVYVTWPHLVEARVVVVATDEKRILLDEGSGYKTRTHSKANKIVNRKTETLDGNAYALWHREAESIAEKYMSGRGVDIGVTFVLLYCTPMMGRKYICGSRGNVTLEKQWAQNPVPYALQATVKDISVHDSSFAQFKTLDELFTVTSEVYMLGHPHYGCAGKVLDIDPKNEGRIRVNFDVLQEPNLESIVVREKTLSKNYMQGFIAARQIGISNHIFSRLTGTILVTRGDRENPQQAKINIGLNLKFNKKNEEVPGYTRKTEEGVWLYSRKAVDTIHEYSQKFPKIFDYISSNTNFNDTFYEKDIFPGEESGQKFQDLVSYLKQLPCASVQRMQHGSEFLDEMVVTEIEKEVGRVVELNKQKTPRTRMQVKPHLLYRPLEHTGTLVPDPSATYQLFDRVVNVREGYTVPLGLRGTVIGIAKGEKEADVTYDVVFDEEFLSGLTIRCSPNRGYRMPSMALINLSHGLRKQQPNHLQKRAVDNQSYNNSRVTQSGDSKKDVSYASAMSHQQFRKEQHKDTRKQIEINSKMSREDFLKIGHSEALNQPQTMQHKEYSNIWNKLKDSGLTGATAEEHNSNQASLAVAAKALKTQFSENNEHVLSKNQSDSTHKSNYARQKFKPNAGVTILKKADSCIAKAHDQYSDNKVFTKEAKLKTTERTPKKQTNSNKQAQMSPPSKEASNEEFSALFTALQISAEKQHDPNIISQTGGQSVHTGTAVLKKMLNLPANESPQGGPAIESSQRGPAAQSSQYNKVSVQELFEGAKMHGHGEVKQQQPKRSAVVELAALSNHNQMPPPRYELSRTAEGLFLAYVTLGSGMRVQGSACRSQEQASESAAGITLLQLSRKNAMMSGPRHPSAFTPVRHPVFMQGIHGGRPQQFVQLRAPIPYQQQQQFQVQGMHINPRQVDHRQPAHHVGHQHPGHHQIASQHHEQHQAANQHPGHHQIASQHHGQHQAANQHPGHHQIANQHGQHQAANQHPGHHQIANQHHGQYHAANQHPGHHQVPVHVGHASGHGEVHHVHGQHAAHGNMHQHHQHVANRKTGHTGHRDEQIHARGQSDETHPPSHESKSQNPFIPLQVTRKNVTPHKQKSETHKATVSVDSKKETEANPRDTVIEKDEKVTDGAKAAATKTVKVPNKQERSSFKEKEATVPNKPAAKNPKSRLAANFGGAS